MRPHFFSVINYWFFPCAIVAIITFASQQSNVSVQNDKTIHFLVYSLLAYFISRALHLSFEFKKNKIFYLAVFLVSLYGLIDEIHQYFIPGRSCSFGDWVADTLGAMIGAYFYVLQNSLQRSSSSN